MKLSKARERREEIKKMRKIHLMDKNQQAIERAQKNIDNKRKLLQQQSSRIEKVKARREKMEEREKRRVLASIENKLNSAVSRAEQISKKKQIKAKNMRRLEKAKKRREISEFERRSNLLSSVDRRSNLAQKNMEMLLKDRQCKAREQIEHAQRVSSRVRAARILQRAMRSIFGVKEHKDQGSAAIKIQCWAPWRVNVACRRLFSHSGETTPALDSLRLLLSSMGHGTKRRRSCSSFDNLTTMMTKDVVIDAAKKFLATFDPIFGNTPCISSRTLLSAFLVSQEPIAVLGPKRSSDRCSFLLENASHRLLESLTDLVLIDPSCEEYKNCASLLATTASSLMSYCTLFDKWKNSDKEDLVAQMSKSAVQSWVAYLVAKDALLYIEEKENEIYMGNNDPFFQQKVRCSSAKKGSWSHIKRIRTSLEKLLGKGDGLEVMKKAKRSAIEEVDRDSLLIKAKVEIDDIMKEYEVRKSESDFEDTPEVDLSDSAALDDVNEHVVHEILLADNNDIATQLFQEPAFSICDCVDSFMAKYVDMNSTSSDTSEVSVEVFAFTMEKAYFDQMKDDWVLRKDLRGIRDMVAELLAKMRKLVPNRKDLHDYFSEKEARSCSNAMDFLALMIRISEVMGDSLESPARAKSTLKWHKATVLYGCGKSAVPFNLPDIESYVVTSIAFLVKKLDVCHADIVNFKLMKVTPLIRNNGIYYERKRFIERCGGSLEDLHGTRSWIARVNQIYEDCNSNLRISLKKGFVDEILFVRERIAMPEVLCLDADRIGSIRERVQRIVISSALFLHTCTIMHVRSTHFDQSLLVKIAGHKDALMKALRNNLSFDELLDRSLSTLLFFIKGVSYFHF